MRISIRSLLIAGSAIASLLSVMTNPSSAYTLPPWEVSLARIVYAMTCLAFAIISIMFSGASIGYDLGRSRKSVLAGVLAAFCVVVFLGVVLAMTPVIPTHPPKNR